MRTESRSVLRGFVVPLLLLPLVASANAQWIPGDSGTKASLRGIHNAGGGVAWASGAHGAVLRSEDDGYVWQQCPVPTDAANLDFRSVWGWNANHAVVMSSGPGTASRLFETRDGCAHWQLLATNQDVSGFWNALAFRDQQRGMMLGDPVNGLFVIQTTSDGGRHWSRDESAALRADAHTEGAFAASNSALVLSADSNDAYFATGGRGGARVFHWHSGEWTVVRLPMTRPSEAAGIFSIHFRDAKHGVAVGGDYKQPNAREDTAFRTSDGGVNWQAALSAPSGYRSAVDWDPDANAWIAVGPNGSDASRDDGRTWKFFDKAAWNALSLPWVAGPDGRIAMLDKLAR